MMKKIYTLLLAMVCTFTAFSQRIIDLELLPTKMGTSMPVLKVIAPYDTVVVDDSTRYIVLWTIVNNGPDAVLNSDTLRIKTFNGTVYKISMLLPAGDTMKVIPSWSPIKFSPPANATLPYIDTLIWCDSLWVDAGASSTTITDPNIANNHDCVPIIASAMKTSDIDDLDDGKSIICLYPNPASDKLRVSFEFTRHAITARLLLRNTVGQVLYSYSGHNLSGTQTHDIDVSHLSAGLYLVELHYGDQTVVSKLMIQ